MGTDPGPDVQWAVPGEMRTVASTVVFESPWMRVRSDDYVRADGTGGTYGVVDKDDFAIVIAEQDGRFHLVEQYRYPLRRRSWEFPMGGWPVGKTGTALDLARAELAEETGLRATNWRHLGRLSEAGGYCSQGFDVFHATGLTPGQHSREETELDMVHRDVSEDELRAMISGGVIGDSATISAYALLVLGR